MFGLAARRMLGLSRFICNKPQWVELSSRTLLLQPQQRIRSRASFSCIATSLTWRRGQRRAWQRLLLRHHASGSAATAATTVPTDAVDEEDAHHDDGCERGTDAATVPSSSSSPLPFPSSLIHDDFFSTDVITHKAGTPSPWALFDHWGDDVIDDDDVDLNNNNNDDPTRTTPSQQQQQQQQLQQQQQRQQFLLSEEAVRIPWNESDLYNGGDIINRDQGGAPAPLDDILNAYERHLQGRSSVHFGYPYNLRYNFSRLSSFLQYSINNLGDPFVPSNYGVHSRQFEVAVIHFFAQLWDMAPHTYWGYVTTSGTEGNLHGILLGREAMDDDAILYTSQETHYSVFKAARYYRMPLQSIPTLPTGAMNLDALEAAIRRNADKPVILNVNIGTTVKGAVDDLPGMVHLLQNKLQIPRERFYIHCDGALFALMMPFLRQAPRDFLSFRAQPIDSIAVSGHKMLGCPMPCGVTLSRLAHVQRLEQHIEYLNSVDTTIMGSRNGHAALFLWYSLRTKGLAGIAADVQHCMETARYLRDKLRDLDLACQLHDWSSTVVLERPLDDRLVKRWQLACQEDIAHVVVMPNVTRAKIDRFVAQLERSIQVHGRIQPVRPNSPLTELGVTW